MSDSKSRLLDCSTVPHFQDLPDHLDIFLLDILIALNVWKS